MKPPTYPARPINGGPWPKAREMAKLGEWFYEPKYNGWRALVHIESGAMFNRRGEQLSIAGEFRDAHKAMWPMLDAEAFKWADCEALDRRHGIGRGCLIILDVVPEPAYAAATYTERRAWLKPMLPRLELAGTGMDNGRRFPLLALPTQVDPDEAWEYLQLTNKKVGCEFYEGLVAKRADSHYPIQLRSPNSEFVRWVKHRWAF